MGEVIRFPDETATGRGGKYVNSKTEPAAVIILPVVRIDRGPDGADSLEPTSRNPGGRRRRRRNER
jgi:hypothetical protein